MLKSNATYEIRSASLEGNTLSGTVHLFGVRALVNGGYEEFAPSAFTEILNREDIDVRSFWNHNTDLLLGRRGAGTLRLEAEDEALNFSVDLPETTYAEDLKVLVRRGDLTGMSFGYIPGKFQLGSFNGKVLRRHTSVASLIEVSPVSLPAFDGTSVQLHGQTFELETLKSQIVRAKARAEFRS
jgi:HK97 family phage prohead protease